MIRNLGKSDLNRGEGEKVIDEIKVKKKDDWRSYGWEESKKWWGGKR